MEDVKQNFNAKPELQYIRSGKLEAKKIGASHFITASSLKNFTEHQGFVVK